MYYQSLESIGKLVIYGNGKIYFEKTRDLTKVNEFENGKLNSGYSDRIFGFYLENPPKNARKENLNRKDSYYLSYTDQYSITTRKTALYVHVSMLPVENPVEYIAMTHNGETNYLFAYKVYFPLKANTRILHADKLLVPDHWKIPEEEIKSGAHWYSYLGDWDNSYKVVSEDDISLLKKHNKDINYNLIHYYYTDEIIDSNYYASDYYHRTDKDSDRKYREKLALIMTKALSHKELSHYDIENLLKVVDITIKESEI